MKRKRKLIVALAVMLVVISAVAVWIAWGNTALEINTYKIENVDVPENFLGFRIAHISDLHDAEIGKNNERLISMLKDCIPDIIVITGDVIDSRRTDVDHSLSLVNELVKIAPCYYVTGNHEGRVAEYDELIEGIRAAGVTVLENEVIELDRGGDVITIIGVHDQSIGTDKSVIKGGEGFTVLLAHRPITINAAVGKDIDLLLCGHNHGGQFRIPFVGGVFVPNQGFFPEYDAGLYDVDGTVMIISRGIGNSAFPFRVNNRPEIVLIELIGEK